jgi:hypothetical protein
MLKYALAASAAVSAIVALSAPSYADDSATVQINGTVNAACNISGVNQTIEFNAITIGNDGKVSSGQTKSANLADTVWCNGGNNTIKITASPLSTSGSSSGFANTINYTLSTPLAPSAGSWDVTAANQTITTNYGAFVFDSSANPIGTVALDAGTLPQLAGDYSGTVTVDITPGA